MENQVLTGVSLVNIPQSSLADIEEPVIGFKMTESTEDSPLVGKSMVVDLLGEISALVTITSVKTRKAKTTTTMDVRLSGGREKMSGRRISHRHINGKNVEVTLDPVKVGGLKLKKPKELSGFRILEYANGTVTSYIPSTYGGKDENGKAIWIPDYEGFDGSLAERVLPALEFAYMMLKGYAPRRGTGGSCATCDHAIKRFRAYDYGAEFPYAECAKSGRIWEAATDGDTIDRNYLMALGSVYFSTYSSEDLPISEFYDLSAPWLMSQESFEDMVVTLTREAIKVDGYCGSAASIVRNINHMVEMLKPSADTIKDEYGDLILDHHEEREIADPALVRAIADKCLPIVRKLLLGHTLTVDEYYRYSNVIQAFEDRIPEEKGSRMRFAGSDIFKLLTDMDSCVCMFGERNGKRFYGAVASEVHDILNPAREDHLPEKGCGVSVGMSYWRKLFHVEAASILGRCNLKDRDLFFDIAAMEQ